MCGIVFVKKNNGSAVKPVWKRYHRQKDRGSQGFGIVSIRNNEVVGIDRNKFETGTKKSLFSLKEDCILLHHRKPTSTENYAEVTHPIFVSHDSLLKYDYLIVHNGVIGNPQQRKLDHEKLDFKYTTEIETECTKVVRSGGVIIDEIDKTIEVDFNDSECLAIDLSLFFEGLEDTIKSLGTASFVALQLHKGTGKIKALKYGRNSGRPLTIEDRKGFFAITSEGGGEVVPVDTLFTHDYETNEIIKEDIDIKFDFYNNRNQVQKLPCENCNKSLYQSERHYIETKRLCKECKQQLETGHEIKADKNSIIDTAIDKMFGHNLMLEAKMCTYCGVQCNFGDGSGYKKSLPYCESCLPDAEEFYEKEELGIIDYNDIANYPKLQFRNPKDENSNIEDYIEQLKEKETTIWEKIIDIGADIKYTEMEINSYSSDQGCSEVTALSADLILYKDVEDGLKLTLTDLETEINDLEQSL